MRYNYGPKFETHGIMSVFPPEPVPGEEYPLRVPQIDTDGNTIAALRYLRTSRYPWARATAGPCARPATPKGSSG